MNSTVVDLIHWVVRLVLAIAFIGMGITHFVPGIVRGMAAMIPPAMRLHGVLQPRNLVYFTGVCELAGGIAVLLPALYFAASMALIVFLIVVFPANVYASEHREKFGATAIAFWPRYWGQLVLIALCVVAAL